MKYHLLRQILVTSLFLIIVGTPLFYLRQNVYPYTLPKTAFFQAAVEILFALWLLAVIFEPRLRPRPTPLFWGLIIFIAALTLTAILGVDPSRSFWSTQERALGVFTFWHLAALAVIVSWLFREIPWQTLGYASLSASALVSILAFLQTMNPNLLLNEPAVGARPGATFGNPTFLAGYLLFHIFLAIYFFLSEWPARPGERKNYETAKIFSVKTVFLGGTLILAVAGLFRTETRGDILGFLVGLGILLVLFAIRPPVADSGRSGLSRRSFYLWLLFSLVLFGAGFWFTRTSPVWSNIPALNRFQDISLDEKSLLPRLTAIRAASQGFLERPLTGWGWENFNVVFNKHYDPRTLELSYQETRFDKPHNLFLEYLVTGGLALSLAWLGLIVIFIYEAIRLSDQLFGQVAIAALVSYLGRSFFIFDTLGPLLMFFFFLGLVDGLYRERLVNSPLRKEGGAGRFNQRILPWPGPAIAFVAAAVLIYSVNIQTMLAAREQFFGFTLFKTKPLEAIQHFRAGTQVWTPYQDNFKRDFATAVSEAYFYNPGAVPQAAAWDGIRAMEEVVRNHPTDAYNHYVLVDMYNQVSDLDPQTLLPKAEAEAAVALELSPNRQEVMFSLAKTKTLEGDTTAALKLVKQALDLDSQVPDAHFYYGLLAFANHDNDTGYREIKQALALGRNFKNYHEPLAIANFFADAGHLDEAIGFYERAKSMEPDPEVRIKLGVAYYFNREPEAAREEIRAAMRQTDLTKSARYADLLPILRNLGLVP